LPFPFPLVSFDSSGMVSMLVSDLVFKLKC
jgi:hypothetical protein